MYYVFKQLDVNEEVHYVRALAEPFHPLSAGVRVPQLMARETITYAGFEEVSINVAAGESQ